jgi:hypothetical protein
MQKSDRALCKMHCFLLAFKMATETTFKEFLKIRKTSVKNASLPSKRSVTRVRSEILRSFQTTGSDRLTMHLRAVQRNVRQNRSVKVDTNAQLQILIIFLPSLGTKR